MTAANARVGEDGLTYNQRWLKNNPDKVKAANSKVGVDGLTYIQRWQKNNQDKVKAASSKVGVDGFTALQRWNSKNPGKQSAYNLKFKYGLTPETFAAMLAEQGNACAICRQENKKWCVDHDHTTGKVRSILCYCCNIAIGNLQDSARLATAAAEYLTKHEKP